jgi:hypothetical protein
VVLSGGVTPSGSTPVRNRAGSASWGGDDIRWRCQVRDGQPEAAADATVVHLDNTLKDYRQEIQRRVFGQSQTRA